MMKAMDQDHREEITVSREDSATNPIPGEDLAETGECRISKEAEAHITVAWADMALNPADGDLTRDMEEEVVNMETVGEKEETGTSQVMETVVA
jgi:hypothetical protein